MTSKRNYIAAHYDCRCNASIVLHDKSGAQCMRKAVTGNKLCKQHEKLYLQRVKTIMFNLEPKLWPLA